RTRTSAPRRHPRGELMPIIDARKHTAPHNDDTPRRQAINDLSLTVNDIVPVANTTERAQVVADLAAAGFPTGSGRPLYVHRMDAPAGSRLEVNDGGSPFRRVVPLIQHGVRQMPPNTLAAGAGTSNGGTVTLAEPMPSANYDVQV